MGKYRITGPDGTYEVTAPDDVPPEQVMAQVQGHLGVQKPHLDQSYLAGLARTGLGQGMAFGLGDEAMALGRSIFGDESYDDALKDERAKIEQFREENPKTALAAELAGSFATPGIGLATGALKPAATMLGKVGQGALVGSGLGGVYGVASAEGGDGDIIDQAANRLEGGLKGAIAGGAVGGLLPAAGIAAGGALTGARNAAAPAIKAVRGHIDDAADEIMAARLRSAGETPTAMRDQLAAADRAGTFYGGGKSASVTESPMALADLSPSMQKLAGSASRSSDEAATRADAFLNTRQTGVPPRSLGGMDAIADSGLTARNPLAPLEKKAAPAGQYERVKDALTRAMTIKDKDFHEFGENAYRTEQSMMDALKTKSDQLYSDARNAAQNFNVQSVIAPVIQKIANDAAAAPIGEARLIRGALRQFTTGDGKIVTSLDGFDKAKRAVDGLIGVARTRGDKNAERVLTGVKNDLIAAVDAVPDQAIGQKYKAARNYFSSQMDMKDAIDLGRAALKENSDVVADQFAGLTEGQKKLFRLGLIESFEANMGRRKRTNDITQAFETPRVQELLREVIPRSEKSTATFADRPERFGDFVANEKAMVKTGNKVLGNSATQERAMDDAKFTRQGLGQMIDGLRGSGLTGVILETTSAVLNKIFGMREDVAAEISRRLFTADPARREAVLQRLEQVYGKAKLPQFLSAMSKVGLVGNSGLAAMAGQHQGEAVRPTLKGGMGPRYDNFGNLRTSP